MANLNDNSNINREDEVNSIDKDNTDCLCQISNCRQIAYEHYAWSNQRSNDTVFLFPIRLCFECERQFEESIKADPIFILHVEQAMKASIRRIKSRSLKKED